MGIGIPKTLPAPIVLKESLSPGIGEPFLKSSAAPDAASCVPNVTMNAGTLP